MLILPLILSLAGVGGIGGYIALRLFAPGLLAVIGGVLRAIPPKVWLAIAALAFVCGLLWWHIHEVKAAYNRGYATATVERDAKWSEACDAFLKFNRAGGREIRGLTNRRKAERAICLKGL